jgi:D-alanine-D-alanine ligase
MKKRITVGILCGGKSAEHEVSLQSAKNVFDAIDKAVYEPLLIGITKTGKWLAPRSEAEAAGFIRHADDPRRIALDESGAEIGLGPGGFFAGGRRVEAVFPLLHGPFGEDGTVQGLLKLAGLPFVGSGVLASAAGMDKDVMKRLLREAGLPIGRFRAVRRGGPVPAYQDLVGELGTPLFIKPANMGSSVGVNQAGGEAEYQAALAEAFQYDAKVLIEEYIEGRELECSVLGNEEPLASVPGEVRAARGFYSYSAKYLDEGGAVLEIPARVPEEAARTVQRLAVQTFKALGAEGLARVDFFLTSGGMVVINEINTMPGFTRISMYPKLWEAGGLSYTALIDRLIRLALARFAEEQRLKSSR